MKDGSVCIHHRNIQFVAIEMFKVKNDLCPEILKGPFKLNPSLKNGKDFLRPNVNKVFKGEGALRWFGPIVWNNMLPENLKTMSNAFLRMGTVSDFSILSSYYNPCIILIFLFK